MNRRNFLGLAAPAAAASAVGVSAAQAMTPGEKADWRPIKRGRLARCSNCGCEVNGYLVADPRAPGGVCLECEETLKALPKIDMDKQSAELQPPFLEFEQRIWRLIEQEARKTGMLTVEDIRNGILRY